MSLFDALRWAAKLSAYSRLIRLDRPIGSELLLWPTLGAVRSAAEGRPQWRAVGLFGLGTVLMRSAGCAINDFADRQWDGQIQRTAQRPLATGEIKPAEAVAVFAVLVALSGLVLFFLPRRVVPWAFAAVGLAALYPFTKRWIWLPQVVLGAAFSWGIPMAFVSAQGTTTHSTWLWYMANLAWTVAYDTQYAMSDRDDDQRVGIKSTALLFGRFDRVAISALQATALVLWYYAFKASGQRPQGRRFVAGTSLLFTYQAWAIRSRDADKTLGVFLHNRWVGRWLMVNMLI